MSKKTKHSVNHTNKIENNDSEDISIDFTKVKKIFTHPAFIIALLLIIPIFLAAFFRLYPLYMPIADDWAENSIQNSIKSSFTAQVNAQYPNLPDYQKQQIVEKQASDYISQNKAAYDQAITQNADALRAQFQDENGVWYLSDIDTWYQYQKVRNIVDTGYAYKIGSDGKMHEMNLAPLNPLVNDKFKAGDFHVWFGVFIHKIISFFNRDASVMYSFFFVSVIISALSVIPAFFLARKIGGNVGGFFAACIVGIHSVFLGRTGGGIVDTDAWNVFFPLFISWFFIEAFESEKWTPRIIWGALTGFAVGMYSFTWVAWWYVFDFLFYGMIGYFIYYMIIHRDEILNLKVFKQKKLIDSFSAFIIIMVVSGIFVSQFSIGTRFLDAPLQPFQSLSLKQATNPSLWPNVLTTVAELNEASIPQIIGSMGGKLFLLIALVGMLFTMTSNKKKDAWLIGLSIIWFFMIVTLNDKLSLYMFIGLLSLPIIIGLLLPLIYKDESIDAKYAIFMTLWFMATIFTSTKGVRFILLLVPVFGILFGIAIGKIYQLFTEWFSKELDMNVKITKVMTIILLLLLFIAPIKAGNQIGMNEVPMMNDGWYQSLEKIKNESSPDAIINSWWDFGHWFKAIGDRRVTFDGGTQNTPIAHWIGKSLLTNDEDFAVGTLRMLDCGSTLAFDSLDKNVNDMHKSISIIYSILPEYDKSKAKKTLLEYIDEKSADDVLKYTHCTPPDDYFITSEDMVGKSGVWAHFGAWDFKKAEMWSQYRSLSFDEFVEKATTELGYDEKTAKDYYYQIQSLTSEGAANSWISPWPSYMSGKTACQESKEQIVCQNGLIVNKTDFEANIPTQGGLLHPKTFAYLAENGKFVTKLYEKGKVLTTQDGTFIGAILIKNGDAYYSILMDDRLTESLFTKLFYFDGAGTSHFEKFSDVRDVTGARIIVWKVRWE